MQNVFTNPKEFIPKFEIQMRRQEALVAECREESQEMVGEEFLS